MTIGQELATLPRMSVKDLLARYAELFGEQPRTNNRPWLIKRIAWRIQALAEGDLSERARKRAAELANDADIRTTAPRQAPERTKTADLAIDRRLPPPGSLITREYKGQTLHVRVLPDGFEYLGERYPSLSAVAKAITGSHCNGFLFFQLARKGGSR
jgi:hypothetical protein